ncbi:MAG: alpha,2-mannosyltransferase [Actinomycetota bacterium]|nr:alpha,2-mannosyltransferase [Actinomycetota bacterium]
MDGPARHPHLWHGPGMVRRAWHGAGRAPMGTVAAIVVLLAAVGPLVWLRVYGDFGTRLVDLEVYRDAGRSLLVGRPLYSYLTPVPQLLPFTYPPFSALLAVPLAWLPLGVANWIWTLGTLAVLGWLVLVGFRPTVRRFSERARPVAVAGLISVIAWTLPIRDEFRYGQVGIFLTALCVLDCVLPKTRWPRGMMVGFAVAVKLTPGVFIPYLWLTGRRRAAVVATLWFVGLSLATAIAMPQASKVFWTSAIFDNSRVGDNAATPNQSLRSIFLRSLPGSGGTVLWVVTAAVVAIVGYRFARTASLAGDEVRGIAIVGLLAVLLSPVAWIHHLAGWIPLVVGAMLGDGRDRRRVFYAVAATVFFLLEIPWWGRALLGQPHTWHFVDRVMQDSFALGALFAVWLLGRMGASSTVRTPAIGHADSVRR